MATTQPNRPQPTFANAWNADALEDALARWQKDPESVDATWQAFFEGFALGLDRDSAPAGAQAGDDLAMADLDGDGTVTADEVRQHAILQARFTGAIYAFRSIGHTQANINPLRREPPQNPRLSAERLGFAGVDPQRKFHTGNYLDGIEMSIEDLLESLRETYCGPLGVEYLHIQDTPQRRWLQAMMEPTRNRPSLSHDQKLRILEKVSQAEIFERFLHTKFVGQKRFGVEGGESLIAALDAITNRCGDLDIAEIMLGMAHRGRLNVLANILGRSYEYIVYQFSENYQPDLTHGDGDVKYHLGYDAEVRTPSGNNVVIRLAANPSHLEAVNPVVLGRARARQRIVGEKLGTGPDRGKVLPILLHGDAAFAGQGIVAEVLNFSKLKGYTTGGTVHFIINNQIGFTTDPTEARSSTYCTDVAKMIEAPIFHVNGDDPEAVVHATLLALAFRQKFQQDVVIDMYCYRRHGHNESDEPAFTQPLLYRQIKDHPLISKTYAKKLRDEGVVSAEEIDAAQNKQHQLLEDALDKVKSGDEIRKDSPKSKQLESEFGHVADYQEDYAFKDVDTSVSDADLSKVAECLTSIPEDFQVNRKIRRLFEKKGQTFANDDGIDWAFAESLAWGTLLLEGSHVRISGQDSARGTFSQRHAVLKEIESTRTYTPLANLPGRKGHVCIHNSSLSEAGVLGFDYGYSLDFPSMLCMWEAQFGDFVNGAQVIIDQFIVSSESKWQRVSGLVLLLPHGYEGQGPEHSSARMERFLQLCAEDNIQVANLTTPAQYFHILRRQMHRPFRKPLVIMSPKSLLRHRDAVSPRAHFTEGCFLSILDDDNAPEKVDRLILCSGKVYYDLLAHRREQEKPDAAIIRIEQLYPFNEDLMGQILARYNGFSHLVWCQEEPQNMGAWSFIAPRLEELVGRKPLYAGRLASASPAVGAASVHARQQEALVKQAFTMTSRREDHPEVLATTS